MVSMELMLMAIGQKIALKYEHNPLKSMESQKFIPQLQQTLDALQRMDPQTMKTLIVESDIPKFLSNMGRMPYVSMQ